MRTPRHLLLSLIGSAVVALAPSLYSPAALAAAPQVKTQAPGFYRLMVGSVEVTALSDGTVDLPVDKLLTHTTADHVGKALARNFQRAPLETSVNGYLLNTGSKIYITHMHPDHVGGLAAGSERAFPNAMVRADKRDSDFWLSAANLEKAPTDAKGFFQGAQASLTPYVQAGKFLPFDGDTDLLPGLKAHASYGHTPGHTVYVLESQGQKIVFWGDLMHVAAVQFDEPAVTIAFDTDSKAAAVERKKAFAEAAKNGYLVAASHLPFPGIGHLRKNGAGYAYLPVTYSVPR